jgi:Concanavalin A-like lectin/glucanases superfamily
MRKGPIVFGLTLVVAVASLGAAVKMRKDFTNYQADHPPGMEFKPGRCTSRGLVAHWKFDEISATKTPDASGQGNDGEFGIPLKPFAKYRYARANLVPGRIGKALDFQLQQWVLAENSACFANDEASFMAWVWMDDSALVPTIAAKSAWPLDGWWLCTTTMFPQKRERFLDLGIAWGSDMTHVESGWQMPLKEWHHVAVTMDNERHEVEFYVDGALFGEKHTNVHKWVVDYANPFVVGDYDGSGRWPWHGKIDDVRVYNRVVTADEVRAAYAEAPK